MNTDEKNYLYIYIKVWNCKLISNLKLKKNLFMKFLIKTVSE